MAAIACQSIPPDWYDDDRYLITIVDVLNRNAERMKRRK